MDQSGAITEQAKDLNDRRVTYDGGAARARAQDLRRVMLAGLPSERILDKEHMVDLVEDVATWAPDAVRQKALRKAGASQLWGRVLTPQEYADLEASAREYMGK